MIGTTGSMPTTVIITYFKQLKYFSLVLFPCKTNLVHNSPLQVWSNWLTERLSYSPNLSWCYDSRIHVLPVVSGTAAVDGIMLQRKREMPVKLAHPGHTRAGEAVGEMGRGQEGDIRGGRGTEGKSRLEGWILTAMDTTPSFPSCPTHFLSSDISAE